MNIFARGIALSALVLASGFAGINAASAEDAMKADPMIQTPHGGPILAAATN